MMVFRFTLPALLLSLLSACSVMPAGGDIYSLRRDAQVAYVGEQDDRAETLLLGLSRAAPNEPETWFYLGNLYARTNRPEKAVDAYQKALLLNSTDAKVWHNLGVVRVREAWAAFIQGYSLVQGDDPLREKMEGIIGSMEKIPLDGLTRTPKTPTASPADARK